MGEPLALADDHPDADTVRGGRGERLDLPLPGPDLGLGGADRHHLDLLAGDGLCHDAITERCQLLAGQVVVIHGNAPVVRGAAGGLRQRCHPR